MKKFTNITTNENEKAIKIGTNVPADAAVLSWYTSESISPKNNIVTVNVSETILENKIKESYDAELMYADELGILRRMNGSSVLSTDDITISNLFLHRPTVSETLNPTEINANDFGHYVYISRYFTAAPAIFNFTSYNNLPDQDQIYNLGIKVLDEFGKDYIDLNTNRKKYKILLEPYKTSANVNLEEIPYRVIVVLDSSYPLNLKLMYNKVESDENGKFSNQQLRYTETINAVKYFNNIPEESFVIDPNYYGSRNFSIKKIDENYSSVNTGHVSITNGYQALVPSKAIKDYRNYEVFNWRIIGKIRRNINLQDIDYEIDSNPDSPVRIRTVKAGILYSGSTNQNINPYVLYRLENSPFNLTKLVFENPLTTLTDKSLANYWKVNIDSVTSAQLSQFDVLLWSPDSTITSSQASLINNFVANNFGTLILDLSFCPNASNVNSGGQLNMTSSVVANNVDMIDTSICIDATKNGGWTINDTIFEKNYYSVIGSSKINGVSPKSYKYFANAVSSNTFVKAGPSSSDLKSIGVLLSYPRQNDSLTKGNILATTFGLMSYCNSIYDIANPDKVLNINNGTSHFGTINSSTTLFSSVIEGPFKLLFNSISYAMYCKALSMRQTSLASSIINFITDWSSSWVMYSPALEDSEKPDFDLISINSSTSLYARNLTKNSASTNTSIFDYFKSQLTLKMSQFQRSIIEELSVDDIEFYVEITNPDVTIKDSTKVADPNSASVDIPSSYTLYKINTSSSSNPATRPLYAYTQKYSRSLSRILGLGPHILLERPVNSSSSRSLTNLLSPSLGFNSYPFRLKSLYTMYEGSDIPYSFNFNFTGKANYTVNATYKGKKEIDIPVGPKPATLPAENVKSGIDDYQTSRSTNVADASNIFPYTGDIDIHGDPRIWVQGSPTHEYVKYIQYTLAAAGKYKGAIDGSYGPVTAQAVYNFQVANNQRFKDYKVDSETKWYLALVWLIKRAFEGQKALDDWKAFATPDIRKYISKVETMSLAPDVNSGRPYRKITFTGTVGPKLGADILFMQVPSSMINVTGITITPDQQDARWRNFKAVSVGWGPTFETNIFKYSKLEALNLSAASGDINIPINNLEANSCRYIIVGIEGLAISPGFGQGEGFGISGIKINGTVDGGTETGYEDENTPISVDVEVVFSTSISDLSPSVPKNLNVRNVNELSRLSNYITSLSFGNSTIEIDEGELEIGSDGFENSRIKVESFTNSTGSVTLSNLSVSNIRTSTGAEVSSNAVSYTNTSNTITFDTSATYYGTSLVRTQPIDLSSNFRLKTLSGNILPSGKNTINYGDGVLLLCNDAGAPVGLPTYSQIRAAIDASTYQNISSQETDLRYGYFSVYNELPDDGIRYGFYDVSERKFLGNYINYIDLYSRSGEAFSRSSANIYIAICALDADGQSGDGEFFGLNNTNTFIPSRVPLKYLVPVYSVKYKSNTSINVGSISQNISKFDTWELPVSNGSFNKEIYIDPNIKWHDWKWNYMGQRLVGQYSTLDTPNIAWSTVFGYGYYDVVDENPSIIDTKTIQVRRAPIVAWNHPTDNLNSIVGIIKPEIKVYIRESTSSSWVEVDYSIIKDINCYTGLITFKKAIVPSSRSLIKVNYSTENNNLLLREVNGTPIPLNPLLNQETIRFDKPLYIYILPNNVYRYANYNESLLNGIPVSSLAYEKIDDYSYNSGINFTYDSSIFDSTSINYNPFALTIAVIYVTNKPNSIATNFVDLRVRGGGLRGDLDNSEILDSLNNNSLTEEYDVLSYWDVYPPQGNTYNRGGYVIIQIPQEVKENFVDPKQIYDVIRNNLTAGVVFDLQDLEGNSWS